MHLASAGPMNERTSMHSPARSLSALLLLLVVLAYATPAHAYLDPGTGSIVLQAVIATIAAAAVAIRLYWGRLKSLFTRGRGVAAKEERP
jgi:hypothetical protein